MNAYAERVATLAQSTSESVQALYDRFLAGELTEALFVELATTALTVNDHRAATLADVGVAAILTAQLGAVALPVGVPAPDPPKLLLHSLIRDALDDVDLDLRPGSLTAIVGPTGSGKSTLMHLLVRLMDPTDGRVLLDGVAEPDLARGQISRAAALVTQQTFVFDDTITGNVTLGDDYTQQETRRALEIAQATGFVDHLPDGAETRVGERGASLSGGQRQRIALARAVIRRPRALLLDDATSAVDPAVEQSILQGLRSNREGTTVVMVAYRMSSIALADQVVFVDDGRITDRGTHEELMERSAGYRTLVTAYADRSDEVLGESR